MRLLRLLFAVTTLATIAAVSAPAQAVNAAGPPEQATTSGGPFPPGIGIELLQAPVSEKNDPRARVYVIDHVAPGTTFSRKFQVDNGTSDPVTLQLYPDAATLANGSFDLAEGRGTSDLTSWISIQPSHVTLAPQTSANAVATFNVPANATDGERYGALVAELPARPAQGITQAARVGIRIYLSVGTGTAPTSDFSIASLTAKRLPDRTPEVTALVRNTGGRALDLSGTLTLGNGPGGLSAGPFPTANGITLGIGATYPIAVKLDPRLPDGPWTATMTLHSDDITHSATGTISFPAQAGTANAPVTAHLKSTHNKGLRPVVVVGAVILWLAILGLFLFVWWRRRKRDDEEESAGGAGRTPASVR